MKEFKRESWEEFQNRIGFSLDIKDYPDENSYWSTFIYFTCVYTSEQKMNWRRQIVRIKKLLEAFKKNGNKD